MTDLKLNQVSAKLHSLEQLDLCESETRQMVTDTLYIYGDYKDDEGMKEEAEQLRYKLMALLIYYPEYFGYNTAILDDIISELYPVDGREVH